MDGGLRQLDAALGTRVPDGAAAALTPALTLDLDAVERNLDGMLELLGGRDRWRPHVKTAKFASVLRLLLARDVRRFKCATTRELALLCELGADDVLLAHMPVGPNAERCLESAAAHEGTAVSVLVDDEAAARRWAAAGVGVFVDLDTGMARTGVPPQDHERLRRVASAAAEGGALRGLHAFDGHLTDVPVPSRSAQAALGFDAVAEAAARVCAEGLALREVVTSGTATCGVALAHPGLAGLGVPHRVGAGTVVYHDQRSAPGPTGHGEIAATVLTRAVSCPRADLVTVDAGYKAVADEVGHRGARCLSHPHLRPVRRSEEHLTFQAVGDGPVPAAGDLLALGPHHICPTVNLYDAALLVRGGHVVGVDELTARGHDQVAATGVAP